MSRPALLSRRGSSRKASSAAVTASAFWPAIRKLARQVVQSADSPVLQPFPFEKRPVVIPSRQQVRASDRRQRGPKGRAVEDVGALDPIEVVGDLPEIDVEVRLRGKQSIATW